MYGWKTDIRCYLPTPSIAIGTDINMIKRTIKPTRIKKQVNCVNKIIIILISVIRSPVKVHVLDITDSLSIMLINNIIITNIINNC